MKLKDWRDLALGLVLMNLYMGLIEFGIVPIYLAVYGTALLCFGFAGGVLVATPPEQRRARQVLFILPILLGLISAAGGLVYQILLYTAAREVTSLPRSLPPQWDIGRVLSVIFPMLMLSVAVSIGYIVSTINRARKQNAAPPVRPY